MQLLTSTYKRLIGHETDDIDDFINISELLQGLCFHQFIHYSIFEDYLLNDVTKNNIRVFSDVAASGIAQINEISENGLDLENVVKPAIECCKNTTLNNGYEFLGSPEGISKWYDPSNEVAMPIVFVAGTQTEEIRNKRVDTVIKLINEGIKTSSKIIFSGKHKARGSNLGIRTQAEAQHMVEYFNKIKHKLKYEIDEDSPIIEDDSKDTEENLENSLKKIYENRSDLKSIDLYLISSTFHLIRISEIIFRHIRISEIIRNLHQFHNKVMGPTTWTMPPSWNLRPIKLVKEKEENRNKYENWLYNSVKRITLVGSEDPHNVKEDNIFKNSDYIKSLYFELFNHYSYNLLKIGQMKKGFYINSP